MAIWNEEKDFSEKALFFAECSKVAYNQNRDISQFFGDRGYRSMIIQSGKNLQAVIAYNDKDLIVSFQGTNDWQDVIVDAKAIKVKRDRLGKVHDGFIDAWEDLKPSIMVAIDTITETGDKSIFVCGHSLGGALAALCSASIQSVKGRSVERCWTFGMPRVGNSTWKETFKRLGIDMVRFVNCQDIVTKVPFFMYNHVGKSVYLDKKGNYRKSRPWTLNLWRRWKGGGEDHSIKEYIDKIKKHL